MKITVNSFNDFNREFIDMNRAENFTYEGRQALYEWLIELEESSGVETELDVIGLCCDFSQDTIANILDDYNLNTFEDIQDRTIVMYVESPKVDDIEYWENFNYLQKPINDDDAAEFDKFFQTEIIIGVF